MVHCMHPGTRHSRRWLLALAAGGAWAGATAARELEPTGEPAPDALEGVRFSTSGWETDFGRHTVPLTEIYPGGAPRDGIPPIDSPAFESIDQASDWLADTEPVIALGVVDKETGSTWTMRGEALEEPLDGTRLTPVTHVVVFWFAWAVFQPDTRIHSSDASSRSPPAT